MQTLSAVARAADVAAAEARRTLVSAVRQAQREGMTQVEIARQIGRSQPEVSRLLHFHGTSPRARALRKARAEVIELVTAIGGRDVRVFGSVATETDGDGSDIDLLVDLPSEVSLLTIARLERDLSGLLDIPVDVVPQNDLRPDFRDRVLREAVPL